MKNYDHEKRILSLDPANRGFGFCVMEGIDNLIDWGVKEVKRNEVERYLYKITKLIDAYHPDVIILGVIDGKGSRRCQRVKNLTAQIMKLALSRKIQIKCYSREEIRKVFALYRAKTKYQIAAVIADQLPELFPQLPPVREIWMSEDSRMTIFNSVSLAIMFYAGVS